MIKVESDDRNFGLPAPFDSVIAKIWRTPHPFRRTIETLIINISAQQQAIAGLDIAAHGACKIIRNDALLSASMPNIGYDGRSDEQSKRQIVNLLSAFHHVRRSIDVCPGMQAHMRAADDLTQSTWIVLDHLDLELHVLGETFVAAHPEIRRIQIQRDVDEFRTAGLLYLDGRARRRCRKGLVHAVFSLVLP